MAKTQKFKYPLFVVIWDDAESEVSWQEEPLEPLAPCLCTSIGFLVRDEPDRILIADSYFPGTRTISNTIKIPRGMIREMYEIRATPVPKKKDKKSGTKKETPPVAEEVEAGSSS